MRRQREASEPCIKAESSSQPTHNKCIAGLSATVPEVQIPDGVGRQQIANGKCAPEVLLAGDSTKRAAKQPGASEPELNPRNSPQLIEKLSIVRLHQASPLVQMQWKRRASEPCHKAESGSQSTRNKRVARISATTPVVQILGAAGMPRKANVHWRCFW